MEATIEKMAKSCVEVKDKVLKALTPTELREDVTAAADWLRKNKLTLVRVDDCREELWLAGKFVGVFKESFERSKNGYCWTYEFQPGFKP